MGSPGCMPSEGFDWDFQLPSDFMARAYIQIHTQLCSSKIHAVELSTVRRASQRKTSDRPM